MSAGLDPRALAIKRAAIESDGRTARNLVAGFTAIATDSREVEAAVDDALEAIRLAEAAAGAVLKRRGRA